MESNKETMLVEGYDDAIIGIDTSAQQLSQQKNTKITNYHFNYEKKEKYNKG
jgi:hypothetical protein